MGTTARCCSHKHSQPRTITTRYSQMILLSNDIITIVRIVKHSGRTFHRYTFLLTTVIVLVATDIMSFLIKMDK